MSLDGKRVFLAGATGMVGSAVLRAILSRHPGTAVKAAFFSRPPLSLGAEKVEWIRADLRSAEDCNRAATGCDWAIMAAAATSGSLGMAAEPWSAVNDNVIMNTRMLEAFHNRGVRRIVFVSSASAYQEFDGAIREDEMDLNKDPHPAHFGVGWAMRFIEKLCQFRHGKTGMEIVIVRAANVYGPYATFDPRRSNVIPALIRKAVDKMDPFEVLGSPDVVRDVIYSEDFAEAVVRLLETEEIKFEVFNVGSGTKITVGEIANHALAAAGHRPSEVRWASATPQTIPFRGLDCSKIQARLGGLPNRTVREGIALTTQWWIENRNEWSK